MSIRSEIKEEREAWLKSGKSIQDFYNNQKERSENVVYTPLKKARYKGVELCEGDILLRDNKQYLVVNFTKNAVPIVTLISNTAHNIYDKEWEFGADFKKVKPITN